MKFGKTFRDRTEHQYEAYYADYKEMKSYISRLKRGGARGETEEGFAALVLSELEKVNEFARVILGKALQLITQLEENTPAGATLERMSNQVSKEITVFDAFTDLNSNAVRKAVKKHRKRTGQSTLWFDVIHGEQFIFLSRRIVHPLLVHFSRVYWACKEAEVPKAPWNPPASFERSTNKFWVHPHKVAEVKAMLLRHLPILELHTPTPPPTIDFLENLDAYSMTPGAITSLYFDCPNNNLPLYHDRVALKEGANLLRIRWYGRPQLDHAVLQGAPRDTQPPPHLKDSECAFVELKTHHEAWTGDKSVKRRFKIRNSELTGFFEGKKSAMIELDEAEVAQLPSLRAGVPGEGRGWESKSKENTGPPVDAKAAKTRKALIEKLALAQEVQRLVMGKRIRPLLVTEVHRTAFQLSSSNEVRVTLDSPLVGFAMPPPEALGQRGSGANAPLADQFFWDSFLSRGLSQPAQGQEDHKPFPFAVLELKLQGDPPPWVAGLVKAWTDCGYMRCIEKYSKYQHIVNHAIVRNPNLLAVSGPGDSSSSSLGSVPPRSKRRLSKKKQSSRRQQEEEEGDAESDGDDVDDEGDEDASNDEGEEEEEEAGVLSAHVQHSRRMKSKISDQERELLAEKPWALRGEVHSHDRPQNSLLEATVDVERATRVAPPPTAEHAITLLDMIKKRCLDGNWDDVTPRDLQGPTVRKEAPHLSQDKSKEGLGELYEKEFLKKTMGVTEDDPQKGLKNELKHLFSKLCGKLDALCNFHYTPKAAIPEMKVQADVAAIAMEEVLPSSVADAEALAPEELYKKKRGREAEFLEGGAEMSQEDRKRSRSSKKAVRRKARRQAQAAQKLVSKLNPGLGNKYEKAKMMRDIQGAKNVTTATGGEESTGREFSTSAKFFSQLQESVTASVKSAGKGMEGDAKDTSKKAAQLRL